MGGHHHPEKRQTSTTCPGFEPSLHSVAGECTDCYAKQASSYFNMIIIHEPVKMLALTFTYRNKSLN